MNSDYKLYLYNTSIDLVVSSTSIYVDNKPMNNRILSAHKGVSNEIYFNIRNRDRKLQNVFSDTLRAYIIDPGSKKRLLTKILEHTSDVGIVKLVLVEGDLTNLDAGLYQVHITRSTQEDTDLPVYVIDPCSYWTEELDRYASWTKEEESEALKFWKIDDVWGFDSKCAPREFERDEQY